MSMSSQILHCYLNNLPSEITNALGMMISDCPQPSALTILSLWETKLAC